MKSIVTVNAVAAASLLSLLGVGCSSSAGAGRIDLVSRGTRQQSFARPLEHGAYSVEQSTSSFWFSDLALEALPSAPGLPAPDGVFAHVQVLWSPEPGRTPISDAATNAVVRVVIASRGEVGLYGGAAFVEHDEPLGSEEVTIAIRGGTLTLLGSSPGFADPLSPVGLTGELTARRSAEQSKSWRRAVSQIVTNATGKSTWVRGDGSTAEATVTVASAD